MAVECIIMMIGDGEAFSEIGTRSVTFAEVPRIGKCVAFTRDGIPDADGVFRGDRYRVQDVIHTTAAKGVPTTIWLAVTLLQRSWRR